MAFGQLSPDLLQSIEIAVKTTGQSAILDLQAQLARVEAEINNYKVALAAGIIPATEFTNKTLELIAAQRQLEASVRAGNNVMAGLPAGFSLAGQSALSLSYAMDDLQYGFSAIVNNAPHLALALGAGPGVAGALGALFVVANQVIKRWPEIEAAFASGLSHRVIDDVKELEAQLKKLTAQKWRTEIDVRDINIAKEKLDDLKRAKAAFEGLNAPSEAEKERGERVTSAVVEGGGRKAVVDAIYAATTQQDTPEQEKIRAELAQARKDLEADLAKGGWDAGILRSRVRDTKLRLTQAGGVDSENRRRAIEEQLGRAAAGDEDQRKWLEGLLAANRDKFRASGVNLDRLGAGLANAAPGPLLHEEPIAGDKERRKKEKAAADKREDDAARARAQMSAVMDRNEEQATREANQEADRDARDRDRRNKDADALRKKADREAERLQNAAEAPARLKRQAEESYGQEFQSRARKIGIPVGGAQAMTAGKDVAQMVAGGTDVDSAMQQALANLNTLLQRQNVVMLRNQAAWEQFNQVIGPATLQLQALQQRQGRVQQQRRTNGVH